jgi:transcriptional regulator with XRE-family HTH domain
MTSVKNRNLKQIQEQIGKAIKQLRIDAGFETSSEFANKHNLPQIQYWRIESGKANLTLKSLAKILKIHKIDFFDFFASLR